MAEVDNKAVKLSDKEVIFVEAYLVSLNKAASAIACGTPVNSARQNGYEIYNRPHVKAYIAEKLKERTLEAEEVIKLVSDTAQATLTDYFKPVTVEFIPKIKVGLADLIKQKEEYITREKIFAERIDLTGEERDKFFDQLQNVKESIIRLQIELERDPDAFRLVNGVPELREEMQLDVNALVADKEKGKVKKLKVLKDGTLEVELYSAADAQEKLMKMHGKYEKDNSQHAAQLTAQIIFQPAPNCNPITPPDNDPGNSTS